MRSRNENLGGKESANGRGNWELFWTILSCYGFGHPILILD
jgi:hypothetical protein